MKNSARCVLMIFFSARGNFLQCSLHPTRNFVQRIWIFMKNFPHCITLSKSKSVFSIHNVSMCSGWVWYLFIIQNDQTQHRIAYEPANECGEISKKRTMMTWNFKSLFFYISYGTFRFMYEFACICWGFEWMMIKSREKFMRISWWNRRQEQHWISSGTNGWPLLTKKQIQMNFNNIISGKSLFSLNSIERTSSLSFGWFMLVVWFFVGTLDDVSCCHGAMALSYMFVVCISEWRSFPE